MNVHQFGSTYPVSSLNSSVSDFFPLRLLPAGIAFVNDVMGNFTAAIVQRGVPRQIARLSFNVSNGKVSWWRWTIWKRTGAGTEKPFLNRRWLSFPHGRQVWDIYAYHILPHERCGIRSQDDWKQ